MLALEATLGQEHLDCHVLVSVQLGLEHLRDSTAYSQKGLQLCAPVQQLQLSGVVVLREQLQRCISLP